MPNILVLPPNRFRLPVRVIGVFEHHRNVAGRRSRDGFPMTEVINLGWYIHIELGAEEIVFGVGPERPEIEAGDTMDLVLEKRR